MTALATTPTFRASDVCAISGIPASTLRDWRRTGIVRVRKRRHDWTSYGAVDVLRIAAMATLTRAGLTTPAAAALVRRLTIEQLVDVAVQARQRTLPLEALTQRRV